MHQDIKIIIETVMKEKCRKILNSLFVFIFIFGCKNENSKMKTQNDETFEWRSSMCGPSFYRIYGPHVIYFCKGRLVNSVGALLGISQSWCDGDAGRNSSVNDALPDSIFISYAGLNNKNETWIFEGGHKLPITKLKKLFSTGYVENHEKKSFERVTAGMAPGGRICIWVDHIEILRFTIDSVKKWKDRPLKYSTIPEHNIDDSLYLKNHPIKYSNWEKADDLYSLGYGFCTEDRSSDFININIYTKEGFVYYVPSSDIDITDWQIPFGGASSYQHYENYQQYNDFKVRNTKLFLPVHAYVQWVNPKNNYYSTELIFPNYFSQRFKKAYINSNTGKLEHFNRIIFGVERDGEHCVVWLDGPGKQEKIMQFKGVPEKKHSEIGSYATEITYY